MNGRLLYGVFRATPRRTTSALADGSPHKVSIEQRCDSRTPSGSSTTSGTSREVCARYPERSSPSTGGGVVHLARAFVQRTVDLRCRTQEDRRCLQRADFGVGGAGHGPTRSAQHDSRPGCRSAYGIFDGNLATKYNGHLSRGRESLCHVGSGMNAGCANMAAGHAHHADQSLHDPVERHGQDAARRGALPGAVARRSSTRKCRVPVCCRFVLHVSSTGL